MTEDVFLGMSEKDPSTLNCDDMTIKVMFPKHQMSDLRVDLTKERILAESSTLYVFLLLLI